MAPSSYPPPSSKTRSSKQHGHHRSLSSNANTLINTGEQSTNPDSIIHDTAGRTLSPPPPPSSYNRVESGRKGNHRAKRSSFSMTSTLAETPPAIPLTQHNRSKSASSTLKTQEDHPQLLPLPVFAGPKHQWQPPHGNTPPLQQGQEHTCCGVVQESVERAREDRYGPDAGLKPQPWVVLKLTVAITLGLMGYAAYVYIGVLVVPMLQEKGDAQGTRREGIGLLVGFGILYLWMLWAYFKIVTTSPGYAKDHIPKTPKPACVNASGFSPRPSQSLSFPAASHRRPSQDSRYTVKHYNNDRTNNIAGPSYEQLSEMLAAGSTNARRPSLDASEAMGSGGPPSKSHRAPEPLSNSNSRGAQAESDTLNIPRPPLVGRTTSTMTVKSMSMSVGSKKTGSSPVGLKFDEGEMVNGSPAKEEDDGMYWEREDRDQRRGDDGALSSRERGVKLGEDSEASVSLRNVLQGDGMGEEDLEAGVMDSAIAGVVGKAAGRHSQKRKRGLGDRAKWLFCCCWWLRSDHDGGGKLKPAKPRTYIRRSPPTTAFLDPYHRYCDKDGFVKPNRAHHCRSCGTCVLRYDHHCPWIGQCVGARNHKFFLNFCQAACVCCLYILGSMIPYTNKGFNDPRLGMNAQQVVIIALAGVFALFTFTLLASHIYMTLLGQTTVENMRIQTLKERENESLSKAYRWYEFKKKLKTLKEWDREWGKWSTEGNIWWIGPRRREWEAVMGTNPLGWILPIGKSPGDGLEYPVNPRFEPVSGRQRRREDWPEELR